MTHGDRRMYRRSLLKAVAATAALASTAGATFSAYASPESSYPSKPIRVIVPYAAGGVVDVQTRALTQSLSLILKQPIVVEAKPGASGNIAAEQAANSPADGYTLMVSASFLINNPLLESKLRWSPKNFTPVGRFALSPSYFVVPASSPAKSVREFVEMAKKSSPPLQYGDGGTGTPQTMSNELFRAVSGIALEPVMYKGAPPIVPDLIHGLVSMAILPSTVAIPQVKGGKLRALANISSNRSTQLPDIPTIAEEGFADVTTLSWYGLHAPAGTPASVIQKLETAMRTACALEEVKQRIAYAGGEEAFMGTKDFSAFIQSDAQRWEKLVKVIQQ